MAKGSTPGLTIVQLFLAVLGDSVGIPSAPKGEIAASPAVALGQMVGGRSIDTLARFELFQFGRGVPVRTLGTFHDLSTTCADARTVGGRFSGIAFFPNTVSVSSKPPLHEVTDGSVVAVTSGFPLCALGSARSEVRANVPTKENSIDTRFIGIPLILIVNHRSL